MLLNFNVGLLGHVDSGKTSLAKVLSSVSSTAAFDKNPQSQERGITLDLGFSAVLLDPTPQLKADCPDLEQLQITFVDCPGHGSLIRTMIGGAQIIDLMVLVIDAQKGIQTQTAECIVIAEILKRKLIIAINKIDLWNNDHRAAHLRKLHSKLEKILSKTSFGPNVPIVDVSAKDHLHTENLLEQIQSHVYMPIRNKDLPLIIYVDHCFAIRGQGTICTGTVVQGRVAVNDTVEIPAIGEQRKVKSIEMFRRPVQQAAMGDRIGICVTQFNAKLLERGMLSSPGFLRHVYCACVDVNMIEYYKFPIKSKSKMHVTVGHDTVLASVTLFADTIRNDKSFDFHKEYEYIDELDNASEKSSSRFALLEFEKPILISAAATVIASKLDVPVSSNMCRLAFWGKIQWLTHSSGYAAEDLPKMRIFKRKSKQGGVQRVIDNQYVIVQNLFSKVGNRDCYVGKKIELSSGETGVIESTFGQGSKVKVYFPDGIRDETLSSLSAKGANNITVELKFKKYIFNKGLGIVQ